MDTVESLFSRALTARRAIVPHMPYLRDLAAGYQTAVEFGCRGGGSTLALMMGIGESLVSYDIQHRPADRWFSDSLPGAAESVGKTWELRLESAADADIPECDLLMDDSLHQYEFVREVLFKHAPKVRHRIVLHDTETYGEHGQKPYEAGVIGTAPDPDAKGMTAAIDEFLAEHPEWEIERQVAFSCGLTTLRRNP